MGVSSTTPPHIMDDIQAARRGSLHSPIFFLFDPVFCLFPPLRSLVPGYLLVQIRESALHLWPFAHADFFLLPPPNEEPGPMLANRKLKQRRRRQIQKRCLKLHRTYSISFNSSNVGKLFRCCILKDCIEVLGNKKKVVRHFHVVVMQRRQRNVQKSVMHVQSCCFIFLNFCFFAVLVAVVVAPYCVCIKGVKRSWGTDVNRKWGLFPLHMPWGYKICTPLLLYSYRDDLTENLGETTAQECKSPLPVDVHRS